MGVFLYVTIQSNVTNLLEEQEKPHYFSNF